MPAEQLDALLDDPGMRSAVVEVFERTAEGSETLQWADVNDALSSGQWGRLIERGVLVGASSGFALAKPENVRRTLDERGILDETTDADAPDPDASVEASADADAAGPTDAEGAVAAGEAEEIESESWAWYDKAAGLASLGLVAGEMNQHLRGIIAPVYDAALHPVTAAVPFYGVVVLLAIGTGIYSTLLQSRLMDAEKMQQYKDRMERLKERKEAAEERGDDEALEQIQAEQMESMGDQLGMFKLQFRPMVWIMLLTIPVYLWLRWKVRGGHLAGGVTGLVVPLVGHVSWTEPMVGPMATWLVWYFVCSIAARQLVQKLLGVQTNPTA